MMILSADTNCSCSVLLIVPSPNQCFVASIIPLVGRLVYRSLMSKVIILLLGIIFSLIKSSAVLSELLVL